MGGEEGYGRPRRPESRTPSGSSAPRMYLPARTAAASAYWALFDAAFSVDDGDEDDASWHLGSQ